MNAYASTKTSLSELATPNEILTAINQGILEAISNGGTNYLGAIDALIELCISRSACFSSGEIAAWIRTYRPDMKFNPRNDIGNRVRSRHSAGMPAYTSGKVVQVSRYTAGYSTTTLGHLVYVYAPSKMAGQAHPFEVTAPAPGAMPDPNSLPTVPVQPTAPIKARKATTRKATTRKPRAARRRTAKARNVSRPSTATVHGNGRLCVPRAAFEALSSKLNTPIQGGDTVYISRDGDDVLIALTTTPGADQYTLVSSRLRLLFASRSGTAFTPGRNYRLVVTDKGLTIDLSVAL
ncbi:MAG: hypothetical protein ACI8RZ_007628 [Myxococcota bacterium]|jgi:hypothetical protein